MRTVDIPASPAWNFDRLASGAVCMAKQYATRNAMNTPCAVLARTGGGGVRCIVLVPSRRLWRPLAPPADSLQAQAASIVVSSPRDVARPPGRTRRLTRHAHRNAGRSAPGLPKQHRSEPLMKMNKTMFSTGSPGRCGQVAPLNPRPQIEIRQRPTEGEGAAPC